MPPYASTQSRLFSPTLIKFPNTTTGLLPILILMPRLFVTTISSSLKLLSSNLSICHSAMLCSLYARTHTNFLIVFVPPGSQSRPRHSFMGICTLVLSWLLLNQLKSLIQSLHFMDQWVMTSVLSWET